MIFKKQLTYYLKSFEMTASELARRSGVSKQTISDWTAGIQPRSIPQLKKVAEVFGISLDTLLFGQENEPKKLFKVENSYPKTSMTLANISIEKEALNQPPPVMTISFSIGFNGRLRQLSPSLSLHLGWSESELVDRPFLELIYLADRDRTYVQMVKDTQVHTATHLIDSRYLCKNNTIKWLRWSAIANHQDKIIHVNCIEVSQLYPIVRIEKIPYFLKYLILDALISCGHNPEFKHLKYSITEHSSIIVECFPGQISSAILGILHQASLAARKLKDATIHLELIELEKQAHIFIRGPLTEYTPNIDVPSYLIQQHSGSLLLTRLELYFQFTIKLPLK